jgi:hypothetical protein
VCLLTPSQTAVWARGDLVTNAADPQDTDQASGGILHGLLALSEALDASDLQLAKGGSISAADTTCVMPQNSDPACTTGERF